MKVIRTTAVFGALVTVCFAIQAQSASADHQRDREVLKELVETDTTHAHGDTTLAAEKLAARFRAAGFPANDVQVIGPQEKDKNLVVRLRGSGKSKPILLLAHLDVVEAKPEDWSVPPFQFTEKDGFFYGRGVYDDKAGAATFVAALLRMKKEGFVPKRDLILALTAGEESDASYSGIEWVVKNHRDLIDAAFCLNADAGDILKRNGKLEARSIQAAEKVVLNFKLRTVNAGGHSSVPLRDNAIYQLATAVLKVADYAFPVELNPSSRGYFEQTAKVQPPAIARDMSAVAAQSQGWEAAAARLSQNAVWNSMMRTTCVATLIEGGHASNALPQRAEANINCRMVPQGDPRDVQRRLEQVIADKGVQVVGSEKDMAYKASPPPQFTNEVMEPIRKVTARRMPGVPIIPIMETGGTDGGTLISNGIPTYGLSAVAIDTEENRAHGRDERIGVQDFYDGLDYMYELLKAYSE